MRKALVGLVALVILGVLGLPGSDIAVGLSPHPCRSLPRAGRPSAPDVENGRILFFAGGCTSCHAVPNRTDKLRLGGGYALKSPFGTFHVPNISPHKQDGIGSWSAADFIRAMREGVSPDGRHYYPAFPYHVLSAHEPRGSRRSLRLHADASRRRGAGARPRPAVPLQYPPRRRPLEAGLPRRAGLHARSVEVGELEPGRLSGERAGPLRRVPQRAQLRRRHHRGSPLRRRPGSRRGRGTCPTSRRIRAGSAAGPPRTSRHC